MDEGEDVVAVRAAEFRRVFDGLPDVEVPAREVLEWVEDHPAIGNRRTAA
ncbi:hypothetical protein [Stieleria sedimenti]|nr:hypothetical protein [Stieleria sedimenti]